MPYKVIFKKKEGKAENIEEILNKMEREGWKLNIAYSFSDYTSESSSYNHALIFRKK